MMRIRSLFYLACAFIFSTLASQENEIPSKKLKSPAPNSESEWNLDKCIYYALKNNIPLHLKEIDKKISMKKFQDIKHDFRFKPSIISTWNVIDETATEELSVEKKFSTGSSLSFGYQLDADSNDDRLISGQSELYDAQFYVSFSQDLIKGFFPNDDSISLLRGKLNSQKELNVYNQKVREIVRDVQKKYYSLIRSLETKKINKNALKQAKLFYKRVGYYVDAGRNNRLDLDTAMVTLSNRERDLLVANRNIENFKDDLKFVLGLEIDKELNPKLGISLSVAKKILNEKDAYAYALRNRSDILNKMLDKKIKRNEVRKAKIDRWPDLNLKYDLNTEQDDDTYKFKDSVEESFNNIDSDDHSLSLTLTIPLYTKDKKLNYHIKKMEFEKLERDIVNTERKILKEIRGKLRDIDEARTRIKVQGKILEIEKRRVNAFKTKYELGTIDSLEVTRAYDDLDKAEIAYVSSKLDLKSLIADYYFIIGADIVADMGSNNDKGLKK